jgi:ATP-dependent RNA helicase RhlE
MHRGTRVKRSVEHAFFPVASNQKIDLLVELLRRESPSKALIFCATREGTSEIASMLRRRRFEVISLSSLLSQSNRERALEAFRTGEIPILVATDVAARGLDITDIELVVNYDPPMSAEEYVHRIGRTGRAERSGRAATLISELDSRRAADIEKLLGEPVKEVRLEGFEYKQAKKRARSGGRRGPGRGSAPGRKKPRKGAGRGRKSSK